MIMQTPNVLGHSYSVMEASNNKQQQANTLITTISSNGTVATPINPDHLSALLEAATRAAIDGAVTYGVDMPVGAATSKDGTILSATYAQDNLLGDEDAHAELMAIRRTSEEFPGAAPDTIAVTLEPCSACQEYLSTIPGLRLVVYVLPRSAASSRHIIRPKSGTIIQRYEQHKFPYDVMQASNSNLVGVGELLLDVTSRNITTSETTVDTATLLRQLPLEYRP